MMGTVMRPGGVLRDQTGAREDGRRTASSQQRARISGFRALNICARLSVYLLRNACGNLFSVFAIGR